MWTAYKKEIIEKCEEEQEFLKLFYQNSYKKHNPSTNSPSTDATVDLTTTKNNNNIEENNLVRDEDDWPVQVSLGFCVRFFYCVVFLYLST